MGGGIVGRTRIVRRFLWLRNWEVFDAVLFLTLLSWWVTVREPPTWFLTVLSVCLVCYILLQGGIYWHLKARAVSSRPGRLPDYFCGLFTHLHRATLILLAGFPLAGISAWAVNVTTCSELVWSSGIFGFAILEYINYYHYQLMHDTVNDLRYLMRYKRLRQAPLASDLSRCHGVKRCIMPNKRI